jgi:hypothetical protein
LGVEEEGGEVAGGEAASDSGCSGEEVCRGDAVLGDGAGEEFDRLGLTDEIRKCGHREYQSWRRGRSWVWMFCQT